MISSLKYGLKTFFTFLIVLFAINLPARQRDLRFNHINTSNGLSSNFITSIIQDESGYMWFGTDEGLNRFNGYEMKIFKKKLNDPNSLSDNNIVCSYLDSKSRLWIGTFKGLCLFDDYLDQFKTYLPEPENTNINTANRIIGIQEDTKKELYFTTESGVLYKLKNDSVYKLFKLDQQDNVKAFLLDQNDNFWFGGMNGIVVYNSKSKAFFKLDYYLSSSSKIKFSNIDLIYEKGDSIWVGLQTGQIITINKQSLSAKEFILPEKLLVHIYDLSIIDNLLYIAAGSGLSIYNFSNHSFITYLNEPNNPSSLSANTITAFYSDKNANFWIGTGQEGINFCQNGKLFDNIDQFSKLIKLNVKSIQKVAIDHEGNWWLGSHHGGINIVNPSHRNIQSIKPDDYNPYSLGTGSVINIFEDSKNRMWVGTYNGYLQLYNRNTKNFQSFYFDHISNGHKEVTDIRSMMEDLNGNLWFISHGFGLFKFNPQTHQYKYFTRDTLKVKTSIADNWAYQITKENDSIAWLATPSGLSRLNYKTEEINNYFFASADTTSISNNAINTVFIDSRKNIWVGSVYGLNLYNPQKNSFYRFYENDGLASNQIKSIIEEKSGKLWISTGNGLSSVEFNAENIASKPVLKIRNYDRSDNILDMYFWERSVAKDKDGRLIFGTENGILAFYPNKIKENTELPKVYITDFYLFNDKVQIGEHDSLLKVNMMFAKEIKLSYKQNIISFHFTAINYIASEKNQYAYMMEGFDTDWNYLGNKREATYTNLDPGTYTFRVIASNNDGFWNKEGASVTIVILPPWWKTWWFRILLILFIISLLLAIYYLRLSFYRKQQKTLKLMVDERTQELADTTTQLEEKQEEIKLQNEELFAQRDALEDANKILNDQKDQILQQNKELYQHRNELEDLVNIRTLELIKAKEKAEESDRLKSSFLANLSHEIRTPLNAIMGFSSLLAENDHAKEEKLKYNLIIQNSGFSLLSLIDDIIDFSKIESGHINIKFKQVALKSILINIGEIYQLQLKKQFTGIEKNLQFEVKLGNDIDEIVLETDEFRLKQILSNLINNAIKFTSSGKVEVGYEIKKDKKIIIFQVKDTGLGIKPEYQKIIFERFRKIEDNTHELHRGAGLGLAICYQLVHLLNGNIWVESEEGKGSVFYFSVPLASNNSFKGEISEAKYVNSSVPDLSKYKIIIAEDDDANFAYLDAVMASTNAQIFRAENGIEVLHILENENDISLILMDIKMPGLNGIETMVEMNKQEKKVPVIAQTAHALSDEVRMLKETGFDDYISKPINMSELFLKINKVLKL